jgi:hypothetical protein
MFLTECKLKELERIDIELKKAGKDLLLVKRSLVDNPNDKGLLLCKKGADQVILSLQQSQNSYECPECFAMIDPRDAKHPRYAISDYYQENDYDWLCLDCFDEWKEKNL